MSTSLCLFKPSRRLRKKLLQGKRKNASNIWTVAAKVYKGDAGKAKTAGNDLNLLSILLALGLCCQNLQKNEVSAMFSKQALLVALTALARYAEAAGVSGSAEGFAKGVSKLLDSK